MSVHSIAEMWHEQLFRADPVDHALAEGTIREFYRAAGLTEPQYFLWFDSPLAAIWPLAVLLGDDEPYTNPLLKDVRRRSGGKARLEEIGRSLAEQLQITPDKVAGVLGRPLYTIGGPRAVTMRLASERIELLVARASRDRSWQVGSPGAFAMIDAAEELLFGYRKPGLYTLAAERSGAKDIAELLQRSAQHRLYVDRSFGEVARDEAIAEADSLEVAPLVRAFWTASEAAGLWWPQENGVVLAERPIAVAGSGEGLRMEWADGFVVGAANAKGQPKPASAGLGAPPAILSLALPRQHGERIAFLREQSPSLPHLDRYLAGEHEQVWSDLIALGPKALTDDHAADALAVAYETMQRVDQNIRTLIDRLNAMGYRFVHPRSSGGLLAGLFGKRKPQAHAPQVPPGADVPKSIARLEQAAGGPIPLSLRAFFDVVGEVDFIGEHPAISPADSDLTSDPLVVYGVEDAIATVDSWDEDERIIAIAPDALHKADISGGDPYVIFVPAPAADAPLEEEPHGVNFVEYLRIAIGWGGFPGWEQAKAGLPQELEALRKGLIAF